ncbi:hypothetical protein M422DRAFT_119848, partial [Sphaerobolus stellatus SS14]
LLASSFVEPNAYWTASQKVTFYKSLARHSRWRPDLIAQDLGGEKTVADVCSYIELLEQSSKQHPKLGAGPMTPPAHFVSDKWVTWEER